MEESKYLSFHVEGEEITIFGKLQRTEVEYFSEFSDYVKNTGLNAMNIAIRLEDVIKFFYLILATNQSLETPLSLYIMLNRKFVLMDVKQVISMLLIRRKKEMKSKNIEPQTLKNGSPETKEIILIPLFDQWSIKYDPNSNILSLCKNEIQEMEISFITSTTNQELEPESSVVTTINEFLNSSEEPKQRKKIR